MESSGQRPTDPEVPLADAAIATEIAHAAARGRGADRAPTLEQLLAAFGESAPTQAARARVAAALRVAGMGVKPDLASAEPGQRLVLLPPGVSEGRSRGRALLGLAAVALVLVAAAAGASLLENKDNHDDKLSSLPATTAAPATTATTPVTTPSVTDTTATETTPTETTPTTTTSADEQAAADERRRKRAARQKRQREAAAKAKAKQRAATASKLVTVRVDASGRPTFLCVDDGSGTTIFSGTLDGKKVFKGKRVRMNIGLKSTFVTVNGNPVPLDGSPAGLDITRAGGAKSLGLGKRPCG
jgi:lipoprotein-anchoring transpeptidase ErfK/SrfK